MARDSSGIYTLPLPPVSADEIISSAWMNATLNDLATAITESVPVDGSAPITGQTKIADGSNAAPGLAFNAESSTGLRRPEANTIAVIIGGIEKLRVKGSNLIVGSTVDGGERLQVSGNTKLTGNLHATGTLTIDGTSVQHGDIDARGNVGADGYVQGVLGVLSDGNITSSAGNLVSSVGNVYAGSNLMGQRVLVNAGTLGEPSINFNGYGAGFYFPTSGEIEAVGDGASIARFSSTVATLPGSVSAGSGTVSLPTFSFTGDTDTGVYRSAANNLDFTTGGVRRLNIDSAGRLYSYSTGSDVINLTTTANNGFVQMNTTTGTANLNNLSFYLTAAGTAMMLLRNDAKTGYSSPIVISRNASASVGSISFKVGGSIDTTGSDFEAGRLTYTDGSTQPRFLIGHTSGDVRLNNADAAASDNYSIFAYKAGATGPVSLLGTDGVNTSSWASARTNTASKRVVQTQINGVSVSSTAGAERGRLELATKAAADAGVVVRATIDETGAAFSVPVTASNLSYAQKTVSGALTVDNIYSTTVGFTVETSHCATGRVYTVYNNSASTITITQGAGVTLRLGGTGTTGDRTIPGRGLATFTCISGATTVVATGNVS